jgi:hypothetical protein
MERARATGKFNDPVLRQEIAKPRIARHISGENGGKTAGGGHVAVPARLFRRD